MSLLRIPKALRWVIICGLFLLVIMTLLRLVLIASFPSEQTGFSNLLPAIWMGFRFDARMAAIVCLLLLLFSFIKPLHPFHSKAGKKVSFIVMGIALVLLVIFYTADFGNFAYLHQRMRASLLNLAVDTAISAKMLWESYHVVWITLGVVVMFWLMLRVLRYLYKTVEKLPASSTKAGRISLNIVVVLLLALAIFGRAGQYPLRWSDAYTLGDDYAANIALNPIQSFFSSMKFRHASYDEKKTREHYAQMAEFLAVDHPDSNRLNYTRKVAARPGQTPFNVVLVICESFSAYKSSMWGNPLQTTPFFDSLSRKGVFFDHCFTPAWGTARGVWASITGIPDVMLTKTASRNPSIVDQHTIINDFKNYEKLYFIGGSTSWANIRGLLTNNINGLQLFEQDDFDAPKIDVWGISDKNLFLEANKKLALQQKPFFAVIQTADNHRPYTIPEEDAKGFEKKTVPVDTLRKYGFQNVDEYNAFRYTDFCFQAFFTAAKKEKYFENTLFVMVGDHGITGSSGKMFPEAWNSQGLTSEHVPLLFYYPAKLKPARHTFPVSQVDINPTIASMSGIAYTNAGLGRNLLLPDHTPDTSLKHAAFIFDPDIQKVGVVYDGRYFSYKISQPQNADFVSIKNNDPVNATDSLSNAYRQMVEALYETSRYMLFHNQKPN